jgi:hypothetical protein
MQQQAKGTFEVSLKPLDPPREFTGTSLGRMSLDKQFSGDLSGTGRGQMLTAMSQTKGSAGYVAIEWVSGALHGRKGSFVFQHSGTMSAGGQELSISVVPGSGTGELAGISGQLDIFIEEGQHFYTFNYSIG